MTRSALEMPQYGVTPSPVRRVTATGRWFAYSGPVSIPVSGFTVCWGSGVAVGAGVGDAVGAAVGAAPEDAGAPAQPTSSAAAAARVKMRCFIKSLV